MMNRRNLQQLRLDSPAPDQKERDSQTPFQTAEEIALKPCYSKEDLA
ncbi:MAG: hypothetical protein HKP60_05510, partial [Eudoraea sp.]|nr:hypothetical protein [Eudoraea sp.]